MKRKIFRILKSARFYAVVATLCTLCNGIPGIITVNRASADDAVLQRSFTKLANIVGCGTMQGGTSDGQYIYVACLHQTTANPGTNYVEIVKASLSDGSEISRSPKYCEFNNSACSYLANGYVGHADDMAYDSKRNRLVLSAQSTEANGRIVIMDPGIGDQAPVLTNEEHILVNSNGNPSTSSRFCYKSDTDELVVYNTAALRFYNGGTFGFSTQVTFSDNTAVGPYDTVASTEFAYQGIWCDSTYIYTMRTISGGDDNPAHYFNRIMVHKWNGDHVVTYNVQNLYEEGESVFLVDGQLYFGVNDGGWYGSASNDDYFVRLDAPRVDSVSPDSGLAVGGTNITITGLGFAGTSAVKIGGIDCTNVVVVGDTSITCTTPAHVIGSVAIDIVTPGGTGGKASAYTYIIDNGSGTPGDVPGVPNTGVGSY